jgi:hypothetical protein
VSADTISEEEIKKLMQRPRIDFTSILGTVGSLQLLLLLLLVHPSVSHWPAPRHAL